MPGKDKSEAILVYATPGYINVVIDGVVHKKPVSMDYLINRARHMLDIAVEMKNVP